MINVPRFQHHDPLTQNLIDTYAQAIKELQGVVRSMTIPDNRDIEQAMVYVKNTTGGALGKGAVVGLGDPINDDPSGALPAFLHGELTLTGETPSESYGHEGKFAVLDQSIPNGKYGVAVVQGVVRVQVAFTTGDEEWADITDTSTATLTAAASGSARILWRDEPAVAWPETVWAVCLIGMGSAPAVKWGVPVADPSSDPTATIEIQPCDEDGAAYDVAAVTVYIRNDRAEVQIEPRGWLATAGEVVGTILSWVRFPVVVGSAPAVVGVLIGECEPDKVRVSVADDVPGYLRFTAADIQAHHKVIGDSEEDAVAATTGAWIECEIINVGVDEQLKIKHIGPGDSYYLHDGTATCTLITGFDLDEIGHVRAIQRDWAAWDGPKPPV